MTLKDLHQMQSWSLERKIQVTQTRIIEWYKEFDGQIYISFSGGKDSTVLLDIARRIYPDIPAVFVDTGLEYPEIKQFVKNFDNVITLYPKIKFNQVIKEYGYPIISKSISEKIYYGKSGAKWALDYLNNNKGKSIYNCGKWKYLLDSPFPISHICCNVMKKQPFNIYNRDTGRKPMIATLTCESKTREKSWLQNGCNAFNSKNPKSQPMSFWTTQDILKYILLTNLEISKCYGDIVSYDGDFFYDNALFETKLKCTGCQRTGCMFCMFGVHLEKEPNRFQLMKETHPMQYEYCIKNSYEIQVPIFDDEYKKHIIGYKTIVKKGLGCGKILDYIGVKY